MIATGAVVTVWTALLSSYLTLCYPLNSPRIMSRRSIDQNQSDLTHQNRRPVSLGESALALRLFKRSVSPSAVSLGQAGMDVVVGGGTMAEPLNLAKFSESASLLETGGGRPPVTRTTTNPKTINGNPDRMTTKLVPHEVEPVDSQKPGKLKLRRRSNLSLSAIESESRQRPQQFFETKVGFNLLDQQTAPIKPSTASLESHPDIQQFTPS